MERSTAAPSMLGAAARLAWRALRGQAEEAGAAAGSSPRRRPAVERSGIRANRSQLARYLEVTRGFGTPAFAPGPGALLPPVYPALWEAALALELFGTEEVPPPRALIHLGGELVQVRPLAAESAVRCRVELDAVDRGSSGLRLTFATRNWNAAGQLCCESRIVLLAPGGGGEGPARTARALTATEGSWQELDRWDLPANSGRRYARASGDYNPIHLWGWSARPFGFRRPILHGFCIQAMVAHALIQRRLSCRPERLRRLRVDFRSPLHLPSVVRLLVADGADGHGGAFRVVGEDPAERPFTEGEWVGSPPEAQG